MSVKCPKCHHENPDDTIYCGKCTTPLKSPDDISVTKTMETPIQELATGDILANRYEIIEELGKGGMGRVYKVNDTEIKERVALKLLKHEIASDENTIERFRNELKIARRVSHKYVCRMYDIGREEEKYFITMEYVEGEDLKSHIRKKERLSTEDAIGITKQICEGLVEAHRLGVVHRDLKPQNIMIDKQGDARIMDFGIARSLEAPGVTATGVIIGTPDYISPEQAEGEAADQRSDIYSLGVILYELVTGSVPFRGDTALSVAIKHKTQLPQDPRKLNPDICEDLSRLILICMEKDRNRRYQTAADLLSDLRNIEGGFPLGTKIRPRRETFVTALIRKKFFVPVLVIAVAIIVIIVWQLFPQRDAVFTPSGVPSIAVLPFADLSPHKDQEYFCDGMTDDIITKLSGINELKVISRTSVMRYKNSDKDIKKIGQELNVATVLEGSIQKERDKIRINVQLINMEDGFHLWAETYDQKLAGIFDIQDEISQAITEALRIELIDKEKALLVKRYTENLEAYNLYLKGRYFWNKRTEEGYQKSLEYFQEAIEKDPTYALAYTGIADYYNLLGYYDYLPPKEAFPKAKAAAEKALEMDETLAEAHNSLAMVKENYDWDWKGAEREYRRAIELNPNYATAHQWYAGYLGAMGRHDESIAENKQAQELDPLSPIIGADLGTNFISARQYDQAIKEFQKVLEMDPDYIVAHLFLGMAYAGKEMYDEAIAALQKAQSLSGDDDSLMNVFLGVIYSLSGKKDEAKKVLNKVIELSKHSYVSPWGISLIYVGLGQKDQAFEWLEKAYDERDHWMSSLKVLPIFDSIRSDPRFIALLKKMNLE